MRHVIVGSAGHIDHGKTSLVRAITGVDADRLKEEKQRGITIDIGFANLDLDDVQLGFVDVPGHERFVKNMLAGAHGIDLVVLVIAADESVMPQTREHFDICRLLGVRAGVIALTKADLVDAELLELARTEVEEFVEGSFLEGAPIVPVSSTTGKGIDDLVGVLRELASNVEEHSADRPFRLPVDRAFTIRGFGTVLTGTLIAGRVHVGESLELQPGAKRVKVRGLQVHGRTTETAAAGQRTAVNLQGVELDDVERGQVLAPVARFRSSWMLDARLNLLASAPRPLEHRARVRFHHGTSETIARVALLLRDRLDPGESSLVQIRLESPVLALPDDRFIIRSYSPQATIGGGVLLDALAPKHRRSDARALEWLERLEVGDVCERISLRLGRAGIRGLSLAELAEQTGLLDHAIRSQCDALVGKGRAVLVADSPPRWIDAATAGELRTASVLAVKAFHKREPIAPGLPMEELRSTLFSHSTVDVFRAITGSLIDEGRLVRDRDVLAMSGRGTTLSPEDEAGKLAFEDAVRRAGFEGPTLPEVTGATGLADAKAKKYGDLLARDGRVVRIGDLLFHAEVLGDLKARLRERKAVAPSLDVAAFREMAGGISRKYTIPLLEWLDRERVTRRVGDRREIL